MQGLAAACALTMQIQNRAYRGLWVSGAGDYFSRQFRLGREGLRV